MIALSTWRWTRWLLIAVCPINVGRILTIHRVVSRKPTPFLSANDRSRWATIRALGDDHTFILDKIIFSPKTGKRDPKWYSIDVVKHRSTDGKEHFFSSKPTLMPVLLAGLYKVIAWITSWRLATDTFAVSQVMTMLVNLLPWLWLCWQFLKRSEAESSDRVSQGFFAIMAIGGTFLTTFVPTLNNHLHGAVGLAILLHHARLAAKPTAPVWQFFAAGMGAGFLAINELPALSAITLAGAILLLVNWKKTLLGYAPPILLFAAAAFGTNYIAHGTWKTPYAHRKDGPVIASFTGLVSDVEAQPIGDNLRAAAKSQGIELSSRTTIGPRPSSGWVVWDPESEMRFAVRKKVGGGVLEFELLQWDNWYEYEGTYWLPGVKQGVDKGEPWIGRYAFHCLVGHYGILSLTPFWICSILGAAIWLRDSSRERKVLTASIILVTGVCLAFYILGRPIEDRNYGGVACGFRWAFWLIPAWLLLAIPGCDWLAKSWLGRALLTVIIGVSVFSAWYAYANPWSHSWAYHLVMR